MVRYSCDLNTRSIDMKDVSKEGIDASGKLTDVSLQEGRGMKLVVKPDHTAFIVKKSGNTIVSCNEERGRNE